MRRVVGLVASVAAAVVTVAAVTLPACDRRSEDGDVVAWLDDEPVHLEEFARYLRTHLLEPEETADPQVMDEIRSRLFDAFVDERMLLTEAGRRGIDADEAEVDAYLVAGGYSPEDAARAAAPRREQVRRRLCVQKLQQDHLLRLPPIEGDEVRAQVERDHEGLDPERRLELRALKLDSMDEADRAYREIRRRRMTFGEAVVAHEGIAPGQGLPLRMEWEGLSAEVRSALDKLRPGQVSQPLELHGEIYLFQVVDWLRDPETLDRDLLDQTRAELEQQRRAAALDALMRDVREHTVLQLQPQNLPFTYLPPSTPD